MSHPFNILIVDDEPAARRILQMMLAPHVDWILVAGEAATCEEAVSLINQVRPELVFLDIELPDGNGFEILERITVQPNIIFTTAYEHYAIRAFESFSIDYLLKPIRQERLDQSLQKFRHFGKSHHTQEVSQIRQMIEEMKQAKKPSAFPIRVGDRILLIRFEHISHFESEDKYIFLHTIDGKKYLSDQTLGALETRLPQNFTRVQKSYMVNKDHVAEIHKHFNGRFVIIMNDRPGTRITSGLTFYDKVKEVFGL